MITRFRKTIAVLITIVMLTVTICIDYQDSMYRWTVAASSTISGDLNEDGCINAKDLTLYKRALLNNSPLDKDIADLDGDGYTDIRDVNQLLEYLLCKRSDFTNNIFSEINADMLEAVNSLKDNLATVDQSIVDNG